MEDDEYRKLAAVEDDLWYFRALHGLIERELERALGAGPAEVLDAGCGTGGLIRRLAPRHPGWRWRGVDASPTACALARARAPAPVAEAAVEALPFSDGAFDAVVSADVLYHLEDDAAALREFWRVLRPGGTVVVNVPAGRWLWSYHDVAVQARRRYARRELNERLRAAGFRLGRSTHWNLLPLPLLVVRRKLLPPRGGGSDVRRYPAPAEAALGAAMAAEQAWLERVGRLPWGSSVFAAGMKPNDLRRLQNISKAK